MEAWAGVVLAAGRGTRMKSRIPKVLHPVCGRPLVAHVVQAAREAGVASLVVVAPPDGQRIQEALRGEIACAIQERPLGTGHALLCARPLMEGHATHLLVLYGDTPLLRPETLRHLMACHERSGAEVTLLSTLEAPQEGLGRVVRNEAGQVVGIVEEQEASPEERAILEVNGGVYCLRAQNLWTWLEELRPSPGGEVYLTDLVGLVVRAGGRVEAVRAQDPWEVLGVNTRVHLAQAEALMRQRLCQRWMLEGVTILHPPSTFIDAGVELGQDTVLYPNTHLYGATRIGEGCHIGPNALVVDSVIGPGCRVVASVVEGSVLEKGADVGPFSHLRPGTHVEEGVHIGNFVEVKKSRLGRGTKVGHFSYLGDATIGAGVNIGAGTVTCNFDGVRKHPTVIEEGAFIGCDTMLVAPVKVGAHATTGAGAVVTRDVAPESLVVGVPARPRPRNRKPARSTE